MRQNENERIMGTLSKKQLDTILALLQCPSVEEASRQAKVSKVSIYEWLKQPDFSNEIKRQRSKIIDQYVNFLIASAQQAVRELVSLLDTKNQALKRLVCRDIIELSLRAREAEEIESRLSKLEEKVVDYATLS